MSPSEILASHYFDAHGISWEFEPTLATSKVLDFRLTRGGDVCVCDVKAFDSNDFFDVAEPEDIGDGMTVLVRKQSDMLRPIKGAIRRAARQFKELADANLPLIVMLVNDKHLTIPLIPDSILAAMYGDAEHRIWDDPEGTRETILTRNGILTSQHPYVSGVAVLRVERVAEAEIRKWMEANIAEYESSEALLAAAINNESKFSRAVNFSLDVYESASDTATPIPRTLFTGENDTRWATAPAIEQLQLVNGMWV